MKVRQIARDNERLVALVTRAVDDAAIPGQRRGNPEILHFAWSQAWEVEASLSICDDGTVEVGWPSMSGSPAAARAALALSSRVADLACLIEAIIARENKSTRAS